MGIALNDLGMKSRRHVMPNINAQFGHYRCAKTTKSMPNWVYNLGILNLLGIHVRYAQYWVRIHNWAHIGPNFMPNLRPALLLVF